MKGGNIVKKNIVGLLIILLCFFASCRTEEPILPEEPALTQVSTLPEDITEIPPTEIVTPKVSADEEKFLQLFEECYKKYEKEGLGVGFSYGELRDIYYKHHDNEVIKNLFFFIRACNYYYVADILEDESSRKSGKKEAAKIDPNYDGPYAKEVVTFAKNLLGDSYSELSKIAIKEEENYWNLTIEEKKDIVEYIDDNYLDINYNVLCQEIADKYGISEEHVALIEIDVDEFYTLEEENKDDYKDYYKDDNKLDDITDNDYTSPYIDYDATLEYGSGSVVIANSKNDLDNFLKSVDQGHTAAIENMVNKGLIAYVSRGTKVAIMEEKITVTKVLILEGLYEGVEAWTIREAVKEK